LPTCVDASDIASDMQTATMTDPEHRSESRAGTPPSGSAIQKGLAIGSQLAGSVVVLSLAGYGIDRLAGTKPVWTLILGALGVLSGLYLVVKAGSRR
jgi:F0F1-type ATP synthase assembly protein I